MNKVLKIGIIVLFSLLLSCSENEEIPKVLSKEGIYVGVFTVKYFADMPWDDIIWTGTLELKDGQFIGKEGVMGQGVYEIEDDNKIKFFDTILWHFAEDADYNVVLDGNYSCTFDGSRLKVSANKNDVGYYEYDLQKQ
jgi:hypothetical protein